MPSDHEPAVWGRPSPAVDGAREMRPGVPREYDVPAETGAPWDEPPPQPGLDALVRRVRGNPMARVFGTGQPARGASGILRRLAYRLPEHRPSRWTMLRLADRLDALGLRVRQGAWIIPVAGAIWLGFALGGRAIRRGRS